MWDSSHTYTCHTINQIGSHNMMGLILTKHKIDNKEIVVGVVDIN